MKQLVKSWIKDREALLWEYAGPGHSADDRSDWAAYYSLSSIGMETWKILTIRKSAVRDALENTAVGSWAGQSIRFRSAAGQD